MLQSIAKRTRIVHPDRPQGKTALRVFHILGPSHSEPDYRLLEGDALQGVQVTETSPSGNVPELMVQNTLDTRVFLMDGQELVGAKQNRILNTDVLVPAKSTLTIPVSCVEAGRWRHTSQAFSPGRSASHAIRRSKMERVRQSLNDGGGYDANQGAVWDEVQLSMRSSGSSSPTAALHDAYLQRGKELTEFRGSLRMPEEAVGLAVFHGVRFLGLDLFDRHSTLAYFWQSVVDSYAIDWLMASPPADDIDARKSPEAKVVREALERGAVGRWESFASPGEGRDHRLDDEHVSGSALVWEKKVVLHLQLFPKTPQAEEGNGPRRGRPRIHRPWPGPRA
ncbi:MAG: hypothetical protein NTW19_01430 [Planctomycetota bacterium]|nr:hypothetical protein [Planctomycetota bacterium]